MRVMFESFRVRLAFLLMAITVKVLPTEYLRQRFTFAVRLSGDIMEEELNEFQRNMEATSE